MDPQERRRISQRVARLPMVEEAMSGSTGTMIMRTSMMKKTIAQSRYEDYEEEEGDTNEDYDETKTRNMTSLYSRYEDDEDETNMNMKVGRRNRNEMIIPTRWSARTALRSIGLQRRQGLFRFIDRPRFRIVQPQPFRFGQRRDAQGHFTGGSGQVRFFEPLRVHPTAAVPVPASTVTPRAFPSGSGRSGSSSWRSGSLRAGQIL